MFSTATRKRFAYIFSVNDRDVCRHEDTTCTT
jgi:hypothetical protein